MVVSSVVSSGGDKVILQTVPAVMCGFNGCSKIVQCFLDPGSQTSFLRQRSVQEFGLDGKSTVSGFGGTSDKEALRKRIALLWHLLICLERGNVSKHLLRQVFAVFI